jgi:3-deoxy-7-phosphoheptulonate synthase
MMILMSSDATRQDIDDLLSTIAGTGAQVFVDVRPERTVVCVAGDADLIGGLDLHSRPDVEDVLPVPTPYKLVSRVGRARRSVVRVGGVPIGPGTVTLIAGPCAVETPEQTLQAALMARAAGATLLRGGAFKPRTSPYAFPGLGEDGLKILSDVRAEAGLPVVTEVVDVHDVDLVASYADMLQVGTRNAQNFALLRAVGEAGKPVLLKRGMSGTIDEWLLAAEYVARHGTQDIVLCERGIRTFETATRNTLDISAVPLAQSRSHLPVIVDPSHSGGQRELVLPLTRAAIAAGADGVIIDVHPAPEQARCDGPQALTYDDLDELADAVNRLAAVTRRSTARPTAPAPVREHGPLPTRVGTAGHG